MPRHVRYKHEKQCFRITADTHSLTIIAEISSNLNISMIFLRKYWKSTETNFIKKPIGIVFSAENPTKPQKQTF
jgi:hypothetical protein